MKSSYRGYSVVGKRIFKSQKQAVRTLGSATAGEHCRFVLTNHCIMTLPVIFVYYWLVLARNSLFRKNEDFQTYGARHTDLLSIPFHRPKITTASQSFSIEIFQKNASVRTAP